MFKFNLLKIFMYSYKCNHVCEQEIHIGVPRHIIHNPTQCMYA